MLKIGGYRHYYLGSERLGGLIGERVKVRFNPELPDFVSVCHLRSDPRALNPFAVPLDARLPAMGATEEQFHVAKAARRAFTAPARNLYRELVPQNNRTISRADLGPAEARQRGEQQNNLEREQIEIRDVRKKHSGTITKLSRRAGIAIDPAKARNPERVASHLQRADELRRLLVESEEANEAETL